MSVNRLKTTIKKFDCRGFFYWAHELKQVYSDMEIYLVGGAVRDILLGVNDVKDYDFVVRNIPAEKLGHELAQKGKVNLVGRNFGVFKFMPDKKKPELTYDIALPRTEISFATGGYRDFEVKFDHKLAIEKDLSRRDFTINAMAYDIFNYKLIDEFDGAKDLKTKTIRTVGNAYERFQEDYSRMLRAIRFSCQLGFEIEPVTWKAICKWIPKINDYAGQGLESFGINSKDKTAEDCEKSKNYNCRIVAYEVIASEFLKSFYHNAVRAFDLFDKSGVFKQLVPEILAMKNCPQPDNWHAEGDVWEHTRLCLRELESKSFKKRFKSPIIFKQNQSGDSNQTLGVELIIALLFHDLGKPYTIQTPEKDGTDRIRFNDHDRVGAEMAAKIFKRLKLSSAPEFDFDPDRASWLILRHHLFDTIKIKEMKNTTIEKYFFGEKYSGEDLLKIGFIDMSATIHQGGDINLENFDGMVERINQLKKLGKHKKLPQPLLNGDQIMKLLKIKPGPKIGKILHKLREQQLNGKIKTVAQAKIEINKLKHKS